MDERIVKMVKVSLAVWLMAAAGTLAYTTPNAGVNWSMEDMVAQAGGNMFRAYRMR